MATVTLLGSVLADTSNTASYNIGAVTPAVGDLLVVLYYGSATVTVPATVSADGAAGVTTFTESGHLGNAGATSIGIAVADSLVTTSASTVVNINFGADSGTGCQAAILKVTGMSKAGSAAILQVAGADNNLTQGGTPTITFATAPISTNPLVAVVGNNTSPSGITPPSGWTERTDSGISTPTTGMETCSLDSGGTTTVTWAGTSASRGAVMAMELDASSSTPNGSATGSVSATGSATGTTVHSGSATGTVSATGTALGIDQGSATGSVSVTGSATGTTAHSGSATGSVSATGSATGVAPPNNGAATGTVSATGSATGTTVHSGSATGGVNAPGSATGSRQSSGSAGSGTVGITGTATGTTVHSSSVSGGVSATGSATGTTVRSGAATGAVSATGFGTGASATNNGSATGSVSASGNAAGISVHFGAATGSVAVSGSSTGVESPKGSATGAVSATGTATGVTVMLGAATGAVSVTGFSSAQADNIAYTVSFLETTRTKNLWRDTSRTMALGDTSRQRTFKETT